MDQTPLVERFCSLQLRGAAMRVKLGTKCLKTLQSFKKERNLVLLRCCFIFLDRLSGVRNNLQTLAELRVQSYWSYT